MAFSVSPKTAEENQTPKRRICSYASSPVLQTAMALFVPGMRLAICIWISDLLAVSLRKKRLNPASSLPVHTIYFNYLGLK